TVVTPVYYIPLEAVK
nr:27 kda natural rubber allergen {tryptic peptide No.14} [Hevea brasiliensis=rubber tree, Peptide Partial, 15 aa] [Hevea brasiliensis]